MMYVPGDLWAGGIPGQIHVVCTGLVFRKDNPSFDHQLSE